MEAQNGLRVLNLAMPDLLRQMENAIQFRNPVLLQVSHAQLHSMQCLHQIRKPSNVSASMVQSVICTEGSKWLLQCLFGKALIWPLGLGPPKAKKCMVICMS